MDKVQELVLQQENNYTNENVKIAFEQEVNVLKNLQDCENIVKFIDYQVNFKNDGYEVYILLEYCPHGTLFDVIEENCRLGLPGITDESQLLKILYDICNGLKVLHQNKISHRDLKIENIMKGEDGKWKICDFGSCTFKQYNQSLQMGEREQILEEIEKVTTPIYRAPEQIDLFKGYKINHQVDIWALGCIMYTLMYHKPPFLEGEKLSQINGTFSIPKLPVYSIFCNQLLWAMIKVNPDQRLSAQKILQLLQNYSEIQMNGKKQNFDEIDQIQFPADIQFNNYKFDSIINDPQSEQNFNNNDEYLQDKQIKNDQQNVQNKNQDFNYSIYIPTDRGHSNQQINKQEKIQKMVDTSLIDQLLQDKSDNKFLNCSIQKQSIDKTIPNLEDEMKKRFDKIFIQMFTNQQYEVMNEQIISQFDTKFAFIDEKFIRKVINNLCKEDFIAKQQLFQGVINSFNHQNFVLNNLLFSSKFLIFSHQIFSHCPHIFDKNNNQKNEKNQLLEIQKDLPIYENIHRFWQKCLKETMKFDQTNGVKIFLMRIVTFLSGYFVNKLLMCEQFGNYIDIGLNLRCIIDYQSLTNTHHNNNEFEIESPLKVMFIKSLNSLWTHISVMNKKIFAHNNDDINDLQIQIGICIMEEQYLLLANLAHLFTAFQIQYELAKENIQVHMRISFDNFIKEFNLELDTNVQSYIEFISKLKSIPKINHLVGKLPEVQFDLCFQFEKIKNNYLNQVQQYKKNEQWQNLNLKQILNMQFSICKIKIPIRFKTYDEYANTCNDKFDFVISWRSYRDKLGQKYQADQLRQQPNNQQSINQGKKLNNFQSIFQSVSHKQMQYTSNIVKQLMNNNRSNFDSEMSSDISIQVKKQDNQGYTKVQIEEILLEKDQLVRENNKQMFNSVNQEMLEQMRVNQIPKLNLNQALQNKEESLILSEDILRTSEIRFLRNIDLQGVHQDQNEKRISDINNKNDQLDSKDNQLNYLPQNQIEAQLFEIFGPNSGWKPEQENPIQQNQQPKSDIPVKKNEFLCEWNQNWGQQNDVKNEKKIVKNINNSNQLIQTQSILSQSQNLQNFFDFKNAQLKIQADKQQKINQSQIIQNEFETDKIEIIETEGDDSEFVRQFDSKASDYLLILNEKNKQVVQKRHQLKMRYTEDVLEYEEIYLNEQEERIKSKIQAMQKLENENALRESQIQQQITSVQNNEKNQIQKHNELQNMRRKFEEEKNQILNNKQQVESDKKKIQEEIEKLKKDRQIFERTKIDSEINITKQKMEIDEAKKKLGEIQRKLEIKRQRIDKEAGDLQKIKDELAQEKAEISLIKDNVKKNNLQKEDPMLLNDSFEDKSNQISTGSQSQTFDKFEPDINNKEKNLAVQYIEWILRSRQAQKIDLRDLTNLEKIGEGAAANVYKALFKFTNVAVKQLKVQSLIKDGILSKEFQREISALIQMTHPNLVMFMGATADQGHPVIVTEFCEGGTLFEVLHEKKKQIPKISFKQRCKMALDIAKGMYFMHSLPNPLMHRDLKSLNILLLNQVKSQNDLIQCKITDFGLTRSEEQNGIDNEKELLTGMAGTFHWMAPEVMENQPYSLKADVYSFGIVMWEILCREPPFADYPPHKIMYNVINYKERPSLQKIEKECPPELIIIMKACWEQDPNRRPNFGDIIQGLNSLKINN